jgi:hypothetical protein
MGFKTIKENYKIGHIVAVYPGEGICIGSSYVHDALITINFDGKITKVSSLWSNKYPYIAELRADEATGELKRLVQMKDEFGEVFPVYTYKHGRILKEWCEIYGWPNVTTEGYVMYENTYFRDKQKAIYACKESSKLGVKYSYRHLRERIRDARRSLSHAIVELSSELYFYILSLFL